MIEKAIEDTIKIIFGYIIYYKLKQNTLENIAFSACYSNPNPVALSCRLAPGKRGRRESYGIAQVRSKLSPGSRYTDHSDAQPPAPLPLPAQPRGSGCRPPLRPPERPHATPWPLRLRGSPPEQVRRRDGAPERGRRPRRRRSRRRHRNRGRSACLKCPPGWLMRCVCGVGFIGGGGGNDRTVLPCGSAHNEPPVYYWPLNSAHVWGSIMVIISCINMEGGWGIVHGSPLAMTVLRWPENVYRMNG